MALQEKSVSRPHTELPPLGCCRRGFTELTLIIGKSTLNKTAWIISVTDSTVTISISGVERPQPVTLNEM